MLFWQTLMVAAPQKVKVHVRTSLAAITLNPRIGNIHSKHLVSDLKCCPNSEKKLYPAISRAKSELETQSLINLTLLL